MKQTHLLNSTYTAKNQTSTSIYQLQPYTATPTLQKLNVTIANETLSSLAVVNDLTQSYLGYVSQNQLTHQTALHVQSLYDPSKFGSRNINSSAVLAVGGSHFQNLYLIADELIEIYNMDSLKYSSSQLHTHLGNNPVQIYMDYTHPQDMSVSEYIYYYSPKSAVMDILQYDASASNFTQYFDFSTLSITNLGTSSPVSPSVVTTAVTKTVSSTASSFRPSGSPVIRINCK
jgi:hypothetical protein